MGQRTLNRPPMTERMMMAATETTTLFETMSALEMIEEAWRIIPAPGIQGRNDRLDHDGGSWVGRRGYTGSGVRKPLSMSCVGVV